MRGDPFAIRLNESGGQGRLDHVDNLKWHFHSSNSIDVAIAQYSPPDWADCAALPASEFMNDERAKHYDIGPGDAVYIVGLFHLHAGKSRNLVIVHAGNIALMPTDEKIPTDDGDEVEGYIVESQALPGASGSPVYVRWTVEFRANQHRWEDEAIAFAEGRDYLLGVWIAAWPGKVDETTAKARGLPDETWVPVGMGIVVPAKNVWELIMHPDRMAERRESILAEMKSKAAQKQTTADDSQED